VHNGQQKPNLRRRRRGVGGLLAVVGLEVMTEIIMTDIYYGYIARYRERSSKF